MNKYISICTIDHKSPSEELEALLQLHRELDLQETEIAKLPKVNVLEDYPGWFDTVEKCLDDVFVFGASVDDKLVGFISCRSAKSFNDGHVGVVSYLYVNSDYRRMGVGKRLWETALDFFTGELKHKYITLDVYVTNQPALAFYESIGFSPYIQSMAYKL